MNPILKTIARDILVLSAQAIAFRLAATDEQQEDVIFAAVPTKGTQAQKALPNETASKTRAMGF